MKKLSLVLMVLVLLSKVGLAQERTFTTYGYFDFEYEISNKDDRGRKGTFDQHHFNVLSSYVLDEHFRVFGEIEWEHGVEFAGGSGLGEIKLERAWVEYKYSDALRLRAGKFLTPYGLFNLRHDATPTFLSTFLPTSLYGKHTNPLGQNQRLYAKFATGLQVLGTVFAGDWRVEYAGYLSNGQGQDPYKQDDNSDKGLGGRLLVGLPIAGVQLGTSYFTDKNGNANHTRQRSLAFDGVFRYGNVHLKSEAALGRLEQVNGEGEPMGAFQKTLGVYGQAAYTVGGRLTPFVRYEFFDPDTHTASDGERRTVAGLNFSVTPRVYLKSEIHFVSFQDQSKDSYELFVSSIAVAF